MKLIESSLRLGAAIQAAYGRRFAAEHELVLEDAAPFDTEHFSGLVATADDDLIVAFRGSKFEAESGAAAAKSLRSWIRNLTYRQTEESGAKVHAGFAEELDGIWPQLLRLLDEQDAESRRCLLTGHSSGGALATLAARRLFEGGLPVAMVVTFNSPRVGNSTYAGGYPLPLIRWEHRDDPIPQLPPSPQLAERLSGLAAPVVGPVIDQLLGRGRYSIAELDYRHAGKLLYLDEEGRLLYDDAPLRVPLSGSGGGSVFLADHLPGTAVPANKIEDLRIGRLLPALIAALTSGGRQLIEDHRLENVLRAIEDL